MERMRLYDFGMDINGMGVVKLKHEKICIAKKFGESWKPIYGVGCCDVWVPSGTKRLNFHSFSKYAC